MTFDPLFHPNISGVIDNPIVRDKDRTPNRVLDLNQDNSVEVTWRLESADPLMCPVNALTGKWVIRLSFESFGPKEEFDLPEAIVPFAAATHTDHDVCEWKHQFMIPANTAEESVYKMVTLITYRFPDDSRGAMAGFHEGPMLTFYQDE